MQAAGASEVWSGPRIAQHHMGGAIMGNDPAESVTDAFGRVHDTDNVFVNDASLLPDAPGVNPQASVMAIAIRNARRFAEARS